MFRSQTNQRSVNHSCSTTNRTIQPMSSSRLYTSLSSNLTSQDHRAKQYGRLSRLLRNQFPTTISEFHRHATIRTNQYLRRLLPTTSRTLKRRQLPISNQSRRITRSKHPKGYRQSNSRRPRRRKLTCHDYSISRHVRIPTGMLTI